MDHVEDVKLQPLSKEFWFIMEFLSNSKNAEQGENTVPQSTIWLPWPQGHYFPKTTLANQVFFLATIWSALRFKIKVNINQIAKPSSKVHRHQRCSRNYCTKCFFTLSETAWWFGLKFLMREIWPSSPKAWTFQLRQLTSAIFQTTENMIF